MQNNSNFQEDLPLFSISDAINLIMSTWKKLAISTCVGALIGFGFFWVYGSFTAQSFIEVKGGQLSLNKLRELQLKLPGLASDILKNAKPLADDVEILKAFSTDIWWDKNLIPKTLLSKSDLKEMGFNTKKNEQDVNPIARIIFFGNSNQKLEAKKIVNKAVNFFIKGGAYIDLKNLLDQKRDALIYDEAKAKQELSGARLRLNSERKSLKSLMDLSNIFIATDISSKFELNNQNIKFLPLKSQIIAINYDINNTLISIDENKLLINSLKEINELIQRASSLDDGSFDGIAWGHKISDLIKVMSSENGPDDLIKQKAIDDFQLEVIKIMSLYDRDLFTPADGIEMRSNSIIKFVATGMVVGFLFILFIILGQKLWNYLIKSSTNLVV